MEEAKIEAHAKPRYVFEQVVSPLDVHPVSGGVLRHASIAERPGVEEQDDYALTIGVESYDERGADQNPGAHAEFQARIGRRVRVTVEVIE